MNSWPTRLLSIVFVLCFGTLAVAELDVVQLAARQCVDPPLRWDNIEDCEFVVFGVRPTHNMDAAKHTVVLGPGDATSLLIPRRRMLRIESVNGALNPSDFVCQLDNGSGLSRTVEPRSSQDGCSLVIATDSTAPCLVHVLRSAAVGSAREVAFYISRIEAIPELPIYRKPVRLPGQRRTIDRITEFGTTEYSLLQRGQPVSCQLCGPMRIRIDSRVVYPPEEQRLEQTYRLEAFAGNVRIASLEHETTVETRSDMAVDKCLQTIGRVRHSCVDIPRGVQQVTFLSTADTYVRMLVCDGDDFLLPELNRPVTYARRPCGTPELEPATSPWQKLHQWSGAAPLAVDSAPWRAELLARRLIRDNRHRDGGLTGTLLLREAARAKPEIDELWRLANESRGWNTFYRDLGPGITAEPGSACHQLFTVRRLREPGPREVPNIRSAQHIDDLADRLAGGRFFPVGRSQETANWYRPPAGRQTTPLRIGVERPPGTQSVPVFVQYDDRPIIALNVSPRESVPACAFKPSDGEQGLTGLHWRHGAADGGTLGGPFGEFHTPERLAKVAQAEFWLPNDVSLIRVWSPHSLKLPTRVLVQYRTSRPFRLSESQFLELARRAGVDPLAGGMLDSLTYSDISNAGLQTGDGEGVLSEDLRETVNHMVPTLRRIGALDRWYVSSVAPPRNRSSMSLSGTESDAEAATRREERLQQVDALLVSGNCFLALSQLRGMFVFDDDPKLREQAAIRLQRIYREADDVRGLLGLLSAAVRRDAGPEMLKELANVLLEDGDDEAALLVSLMLPPEQRSLDVVLTSSFRLRWWAVFVSHLERLSDPVRYAEWQARRLLHSGAFDLAIQRLSSLGDAGDVLLQRLREAQSIHRQAASSDPAARLEALIRWEEWQAQPSGQVRWQHDESVRVQTSGTTLIRAVESETYMRFFRAAADSPLQLEIQGPTRIRLEMRPSHPHGGSILNQWIHVRTVDGFWPVPVIDNRPSDGLVRADDPDTPLLGTAVTHELEFGPGRHVIRIQPDLEPVFVRCESEESCLRLPTLPRLTPDVVEAVICGSYGRLLRCGSEQLAIIDPLRQTCDSTAYVQQYLGDARFRAVLAECPDDVRRGLSIRCEAGVADAAPLTIPGCATRVPTASDAAIKTASLQPGVVDHVMLCQDVEENAADQRAPETMLLAGDLQGAALYVPQQSRLGLIRQMQRLLYLSETVPAMADMSRALGERLFHDNPDMPGLESVHRRMTRGSEWERIRTFAESAGVHRVRLLNPAPESPELRRLDHILAPLEPGEYRVTGSQALIVNVADQAPATFSIAVECETVDYLPSTAIAAAVEFDQHREEVLVLTGEQSIRQTTFEAGEHTIRIEMNGSPVNHFLRVRIEEHVPDEDGGSTAVALQRAVEREYAVATQQQPVVVTGIGPAWIRIDEARDGQTVSRTQLLLSPDERLELPPSEGRESSLYRVFVRMHRPDKEPREALRTHRDVLPPAPPLLTRYHVLSPSDVFGNWAASEETVFGISPDPFGSLNPSPLPRTVSLNDGLTPGRQEDGTLSPGVGYWKRRPLEEGLRGFAPDEFTQFALTYNFHDELWKTYEEASLLYRDRVTAGGSFGFKHRRIRKPDGLPVSFDLAASAFLQNPGPNRTRAGGDTEGSLFASASVYERIEFSPGYWHTPRATLFGRVLSLRSNPYLPGAVDQDIYTAYKATHRFGAKLSDTVTWAPLLDTQLWARASITSNEDLHDRALDHASVRLGYRQMLGPLDFDATYRITRFVDDDDRRRANTQHLLGIDAVAHSWRCGHRCGEARLAFQHDVARKQSSVMITASVFLESGRGHKDFRPGSVRFRTLRRQAELFGRNNAISIW